MQSNKQKRMPMPFWLWSDRIVMFALIFMTSTGLLQSLDSIKVCPLSSINILFMAGKWGKVVTSHYMDELYFLTSSTLYQQRSCSVTCRDGQSRTSVWLTSSNTLLLRDRPPLNHHTDPSSSCLFNLCTNIRQTGCSAYAKVQLKQFQLFLLQFYFSFFFVIQVANMKTSGMTEHKTKGKTTLIQTE